MTLNLSFSESCGEEIGKNITGLRGSKSILVVIKKGVLFFLYTANLMFSLQESTIGRREKTMVSWLKML
jgi:hypothetical protein